MLIAVWVAGLFLVPMIISFAVIGVRQASTLHADATLGKSIEDIDLETPAAGIDTKIRIARLVRVFVLAWLCLGCFWWFRAEWLMWLAVALGALFLFVAGATLRGSATRPAS